MSGLGKISALVLWILLIAAVIVGFLWFSLRKPGTADCHGLLPESTAVIMEFTSFPDMVSELHRDNKMWLELSTSGLFQESALGLKVLDSLMKRDVQLRNYLAGRLSVSISLKANKSPGVLYCLPKSIRKQEKSLINYFAGQLKDFTYTKRRYEGNSIYDLSWKSISGIRTFSFASLKGAIAGSFSSELVEESVRQANNGVDISFSDEFKSVSKTLGEKVPVNVFINYEKTAELAGHFLDPTNKAKVEGFRNLASWGALDAEIFTDKLILSGFTSLDDSIKQELSILKKQEPVEFTSPSFLPDAVGYFRMYGFSDLELFFKNLSEYIQKDPSGKILAERKTALLKQYGIDLEKGIKEMISDEYGFASMQTGRVSFPFFFMKLRSQSLAEQQFMEWLNVWAGKNDKTTDELMIDYKLDNNNTIKVFKLPVGGIPSMIFGPGFTSPENDYFTFINNYLVFADSYNSLKEFIYQIVLGNTLTSGLSYTSLGENVSTRSNLFVFAKPAFIVESTDKLVSGPAKDILHKSKESISKFNALSIQYSASDELVYNHVCINYSGVFNGSVNTVWESKLDTVTILKPAIVINHVTGEKEIVIQDLKNQVYLLSNAGIILWKQMLDGPLNSDVFQVDYFKNGKLQYLFSTRNKIYLLDRNGNPVEKYPINLRSPATAGISVFDYDRDGTIRICVPGEDRKIYMFDREGKLIAGWRPELTDNEVLQPIQHFRVGSKDYVVAIDRYKFYILDRRGSNRAAVKKYFQVSANNGFYLDVSRGEGLARLVTTDTSGSIMRVYFSGKVEKVLERNIKPGHYFVFSDLDGDQKGEYLTAASHTLEVLSPTLNENFKIEFADAISFRPVIYKFSSSDNKIGIVLRNSGNIYLYNNNGALYNGFPLEGAAPFSISSFPELSGRFNMIVGTRKNFLYNYSVQ